MLDVVSKKCSSRKVTEERTKKQKTKKKRRQSSFKVPLHHAVVQ
jgi:hypothetical protein